MDKDKIYLTQTDTTVGFLSSDDKKLSSVKKRESSQKTLCAIDSFYTLKQNTRVPKRYKSLVRKSKLTTFIYPNQHSFRVVDMDTSHHRFIKKFSKLYSTSANETSKTFDFDFAYNHCDVVVFSKNSFFETNASSIYKLSNKKIKKIR